MKNVTFKMNIFFSSFIVENLVGEPDPLDANYIFITNPLKVLRNFGHIIKNLGISFNDLNATLHVEMENYLAEYCSDSLQRLHLLCNRSKMVFKDLRKPLRNVTVLKMGMHRVQKINHIQFLNENNLPNVNSITILHRSSEDITLLQKSEKIHYEKIEYFEIASHKLNTYPFSFGNLKHLTISGRCEINDAICEFISNVKDLKTLKMMSMLYLLHPDSFRKMLELQNILSNLVKMQFEYRKGMAADDVLRFMNQSQNLKKMIIYLDTTNTGIQAGSLNFMQTMTSNLDVQWTFHVKQNDPERERYHPYWADIKYIFERIIDNNIA